VRWLHNLPRVFCSVSVVLLILASLLAAGQEIRAVSPDKTTTAFITAIGPTKSESRVRVVSKEGEVLCQKEYSSEDETHGYSVAKSAWTPDSRFFVYSLQSSGGHSVMVIPTVFCSVARKQIQDIGDVLGDNILFPDFSVEAPDKVTVTLQAGRKKVTVSLSELERADR